MKTIFVFACLQLAIALAMPSSHIKSDWEKFKLEHGKFYQSSQEDNLRMEIYLQNKQQVEEHNAKYEKGLVSYSVKLNHLSDMLTREVSEQLNGYKMNDFKKNTNQIYQSLNTTLPTEVDWRKKGVVTPVKNQGHCGSCWAFSTTGSLEGQHALKNGKIVSLSEQQLVDCSSSFGNNGCGGGLMDNAFNYIQQNGGLDTESSYPYVAQGEVCSFQKKNVAATVKGHVDIPSGSEADLLNAVSVIGPISIAIDASHWSFQQYAGGIYDEPECSTFALDHGVLVVGFGEQNGTPYWLVKNSWGPAWGINGYIMMSRNKNNQCGIATQASYPLV